MGVLHVTRALSRRLRARADVALAKAGGDQLVRRRRRLVGHTRGVRTDIRDEALHAARAEVDALV